MYSPLSRFGASRRWVHPAAVSGHFQRLHRKTGYVLIAFLVAVPWIRIGGEPVFLADLASRRLFLLGMVFTPRDSVLLFLILMVIASALFLFTSLYGRIWCGFACPQTVLIEEIIRRIETWVEGGRGRRVRLDRAPWNAEKIRLRATKWGLFALVSWSLALSFTGFFVDAYELWLFRSGSGAYLFAAALGGTLFADFAWFREQFCAYLCPYARFQGVLTDEHTINVGYDIVRGEPRKPRGMKLRDVDSSRVGECIDCNRCVAVCPAGIDIRDGFQLECIQCAYCIDACQQVMAKLGAPSLVRYDSMIDLTGGRDRSGARPRPVAYAGILALVLIGLVVFLAGRESFDITISQDAVSAETQLPEGRVQNLYQLTIFNNSQSPRRFSVEIDGLGPHELTIPEGELLLEPAGRRTVPAFVVMAEGSGLPPLQSFEFVLRSEGDEIRRPVAFRNHRSSMP